MGFCHCSGLFPMGATGFVWINFGVGQFLKKYEFDKDAFFQCVALRGFFEGVTLNAFC